MTDRVIAYPFEVPLVEDFLQANLNVMLAVGGLLQMLIGSTTVAVGLAATPVSPAGLGVTIGPGSLTQAEQVDPVNAYGVLGVNTNACMKMAMLYAPQTLTLTAPSTAGQSQNYLVQVQFAENDTTPVVLPYLNAANPAVSLAGANGNNIAQNTRRLQQATLSIVAGAPATTGSQTTPAASVGCFGLWVVTVANGQTTIVQSNIAVSPNAPFLMSNLLTVRQRLTTGLNLYVNANTGNDGNNGLSPAAPFLTLQAAANAAQNLYDTNGFGITVNVADGTYTAGVLIVRALVGGGGLNFLGDLANPANCVINVANGYCFQIAAGSTSVNGFKLTATGSANAAQGCAIISSGTATVGYGSINFGACTQAHLVADSGGNIVAASQAYTISGGSNAHMTCNQGFLNTQSMAVTIASAVTFSAFAVCSIGGAIQALGMTFTGSAVTGTRYSVGTNGVIFTNGGGANYFPGTVAGVTATGGQYG